MNIVSIVGARPQFVKAAVVSRQLRVQAGWTEQIIHTGQHYDDNMSDVFFREMKIPAPDVQLEVGSGPHGGQTAKMLAGIEKVLCDVQPDWVIVYGDTNSTLAGALAASKLHIPVAHVEAGLRSFNRRMPEEANRVLTDHVSELLLAPSKAAVANLRREGISGHGVHLVGDVMYDAIVFYRSLAAKESRVLSRLRLTPKQFLLATVHRAENTDNADRLWAIFNGLAAAAQKLPVVVPLHPRTRQALLRHNMWDAVRRSLVVIDPVGYIDMLSLQSNAKLVATDSGGVQKEAFFCRTPCVTLRDETEWVELVQLGWNTLLRPSEGSHVGVGLLQALNRSLPPHHGVNPYGQGNTGARIVAAIAEARPIPRAA